LQAQAQVQAQVQLEVTPELSSAAMGSSEDDQLRYENSSVLRDNFFVASPTNLAAELKMSFEQLLFVKRIQTNELAYFDDEDD
jgi:hypothetical protein